MKAKRIFIFTMCLMMAFAAVSCGGTGTNDSGSDSSLQESNSSMTESDSATGEDSVSDSGSSSQIEEDKTPSIQPSSAVADLGEEEADLSFTVKYNGGTFSELLVDGKAVPSLGFERLASRLTLKASYLKTLSAGEHVFTLVTDGGAAEFLVTVEIDGINFTDTERVKKYSVADVGFSVDFGGGIPAKVTVCGAEVGGGAWSYSDGRLTFKKAYLETLFDGVYDIRIFDGEGKYENCVIIKGMEINELLRFDFDAFSSKVNGFGQDLEISEDTNGIDGNSCRIVNQKSGTLLNIGEGNIDYSFTEGEKYALSFELKLEEIVEGTSSVSDLFIPVYFKTAANNADIGFIRYNETDGLYFTAESKCTAYSFTEIDGIWRFYAEFVYESGFTSFELPVWMQSSFLIDNIQIAPKTGFMTILEKTETEVAAGASEDLIFDFGEVSVIGASIAGEALPEGSWSAAGGKFMLDGEYIANLTAGSVNKITVYTSLGKQNIVVRVNKYSLGITGENFNYALDGKDMLFEVQTAGYSLEEAEISDSRGTLVKGTDYLANGASLTLKSDYLEQVVLQEKLNIKFAEDAVLSFEVTSDKMLFVDFDSFKAPEKGFGLGFVASETDGRDGKGCRLVNENTATFLALGGNFCPMTFEAGKSYTVEFDIKINSVNFDNFVIEGNSCYMPITFGTGYDVTFIRLSNDGQGGIDMKNETQSVGTESNIPVKGEDGFYHISFSFVPTEACTTLTFDVWMASDIVVDNIVLMRK